MDYYIDIHIRPDPETAAAHVLNAVAGRLHLALAELKSEDIGVSFPRHRSDRPSMGDVLRLHGTKARLSELMARSWLNVLVDYVQVSSPSLVPADAQFRLVTRKQTRSGADRVRRRQMKRHGWSEEEVLARFPDSIEKRLDLPFLTLRSASTGQPYRIFVEHLACQDGARAGVFNTFGLSSSATIPWF